MDRQPHDARTNPPGSPPAANQDPYIELTDPSGGTVRLTVAGIGARSLAFLVDWHVRVIIALAWILLAWLWGPPLDASEVVNGDVAGLLWLIVWLVLPLLVYLLYHPVLEIAMDGRTPGKRWAGVRITTAEGTPAGAGALLVRNVFRLVDALPASYALGLLVAMFDRRHRRIGDMAAGTVLVYEEAPDGGALGIYAALSRQGRLSPADQELLMDLHERWRSLDPSVRLRLGERLLERLGEPTPEAGSRRAREKAVKRRLDALVAEDGR